MEHVHCWHRETDRQTEFLELFISFCPAFCIKWYKERDRQTDRHRQREKY